MTHTELSRLQDIISSMENGQGATYWNDLTTQPTTGYVVAVRQTQGCHGLSGALYALCYAIEHGLYFGIWRDDEGVVYYDACHIYDTQAQAEANAVLNDQLAYYHIDTETVIFTDVKKEQQDAEIAGQELQRFIERLDWKPDLSKHPIQVIVKADDGFFTAPILHQRELLQKLPIDVVLRNNWLDTDYKKIIFA